MAQETAKDIDRAAAAWAAKVDRGLSADEQVALDRWASADARRHGALARAMAVSAHFDRAGALAGGSRLEPEPVFPHRRLMWGGMAAAAAVAGVSLMAPQLGGVLALGGQRYETALGEVRSIQLADGSTVWLDADSEVRVRLGRARRNVELERGVALFEVAKDTRRPFIVRAGDMDVRAVGTRFEVSQTNAAQIRVRVVEGLVDFARHANSEPPARLAAGADAMADASGRVTVNRPGTAAVARALSWRQGMLDLDGVTLGEAAGRFARYSRERIVIDDPAIAGLTVVGRFAADDPAGFAGATAVSLGLRVRRFGGAIHLSR
jgi:transmembrane sensor